MSTATASPSARSSPSPRARCSSGWGASRRPSSCSRRPRAWCEQRGLPCFREWADTWLAAALLRLRGHEARAGALLRRAIAGMEAAQRTLELPAAYVLLAEVQLARGRGRGHDAAVDAAHRAAVAMGTLGPLLTALEDLPDVLARRIDAAGPEDETLAGARPGPLSDGPLVLRRRARAHPAPSGVRDRDRGRPPGADRLPAEGGRAGRGGRARRRRCRGRRSPTGCSRAAPAAPTTCASSCTGCAARSPRAWTSSRARAGSPGCRRRPR